MDVGYIPLSRKALIRLEIEVENLKLESKEVHAL